MIYIDASAGGQVLRTALALSTLTGQTFRASNIRANRPQPGLKKQHLECIKALQELSKSKADGCEIGSKELLFIPGEYKAKNLTIDIETAGSITLLLQSVLLPAMFAQKTHTFTIKGGTDVQWSPPIDYLTNILVPQYRRFCEIDVKLMKRGYYPKGKGQIEIKIKPEINKNEFTLESFINILKHKAFKLTEQGTLETIKGISHASIDLQKAKVAERQADSAKQELASLNVPIEITSEYTETESTGSGITLWGIFSNNQDIDILNPVRLGADALGMPGKPAEQIGKEAAQKLLKEINSKAPVDIHQADNLIPLMGISRPSTILASEITQHTLTNIKTTEKFLGKIFKIKNKIIKSIQ